MLLTIWLVADLVASCIKQCLLVAATGQCVAAITQLGDSDDTCLEVVDHCEPTGRDNTHCSQRTTADERSPYSPLQQDDEDDNVYDTKIDQISIPGQFATLSNMATDLLIKYYTGFQIK